MQIYIIGTLIAIASVFIAIVILCGWLIYKKRKWHIWIPSTVLLLAQLVIMLSYILTDSYNNGDQLPYFISFYMLFITGGVLLCTAAISIIRSKIQTKNKHIKK
jgi:uncharacterized membrane protein YwaF